MEGAGWRIAVTQKMEDDFTSEMGVEYKQPWLKRAGVQRCQEFEGFLDAFFVCWILLGLEANGSDIEVTHRHAAVEEREGWTWKEREVGWRQKREI